MSPSQILLILRKRLWMIALALISTIVGAAGILLVVPPRYDATATASADAAQLDPVTGQANAASTLLGILQGNLVALAQSQRVAAEVAKRLNMARDPRLIAAYQSSPSRDQSSIEEWIAGDYLMKNVEAKFVPGSNILQIKYKTNSPTQAALIANTFLSAFLDAAVELKANAAQQTAQWLDPQMEKMRADLKVASERLEKFQREANSLAPTTGTDTETAQLVAITNELNGAKNQLLQLQSQTNPKNQTSAEKNLALLPDSATLIAIKQNLATVIAEIGKLQAEVGENNPKLINLRATRRSLEDQIRIEVASRDKALRDQIQFLEQAREVQLQKLISQQSQRDQLASLQREVQMKQEQIDNSAKSAETARLQSRLSFLNITTLDKATPPSSPAFPKKILIIGLGTGAGLALGIIFALLAEALDRRIRVISDLEYAASAPVLGSLLGPVQPRRLIPRLRLVPKHEPIESLFVDRRQAPPSTYSLSDERPRGRTSRGYRA